MNCILPPRAKLFSPNIMIYGRLFWHAIRLASIFGVPRASTLHTSNWSIIPSQARLTMSATNLILVQVYQLIENTHDLKLFNKSVRVSFDKKLNPKFVLHIAPCYLVVTTQPWTVHVSLNPIDWVFYSKCAYVQISHGRKRHNSMRVDGRGKCCTRHEEKNSRHVPESLGQGSATVT